MHIFKRKLTVLEKSEKKKGEANLPLQMQQGYHLYTAVTVLLE